MPKRLKIHNNKITYIIPPKICILYTIHIMYDYIYLHTMYMPLISTCISLLIVIQFHLMFLCSCDAAHNSTLEASYYDKHSRASFAVFKQQLYKVILGITF